MNKINPYQNNSRIIKNFLRKPYTLIVAILFTIPFLLTVGAFALFVRQSVAGGYLSVPRTALTFLFTVMSAVPAVSFFMMYFSNKRDDDDSEVFLKKPKLMLTIYSVINLIGYAMTGLFLVYKFVTNNDVDVAGSLGVLSAIIVPISIMMILFYIAFLMVIKSIEGSTSSIYLSFKGSGFLLVMSLIGCVVSLLISLIFSFFMMFSDVSLTLTVDVGYLLTMIMLSSKSVSSSIMLIYSFVFLGIAIFAFTYKKYMKKIVTSFVTPFSMKPVENIDSLDNEEIPDNIVVADGGFEPQNPFFEAKDEEPEESYETDTELYIYNENAENLNEQAVDEEVDDYEPDSEIITDEEPEGTEVVDEVTETVEQVAPVTPSVPIIHTPITEDGSSSNTAFNDADIISDISSPNEKYKRQKPAKSTEPSIDNIHDIAHLKPDATYEKPSVDVEENPVEDIRDIDKLNPDAVYEKPDIQLAENPINNIRDIAKQKAETTYKRPAIEYDDTVEEVSDLAEKDNSGYVKPEYQRDDENAINDISDIARVYGDDDKKVVAEPNKPVTYTSMNKNYNRNSFFGIPVSVDKSQFKAVSDSHFAKSEEENRKETSQFCHHCGSKLIGDSVFCNKCGTRVLY